MRQCSPPGMAGRSRPKRALSASVTCPDGTAGAVDGAAVAAPGGGSDCSIGPLGAVGATRAPGGARFCVGGVAGVASGTSAGGRGSGVMLKNCACAPADSAESQKPTANATRPWLPPLVTAILITADFSTEIAANSSHQARLSQ